MFQNLYSFFFQINAALVSKRDLFLKLKCFIWINMHMSLFFYKIMIVCWIDLEQAYDEWKCVLLVLARFTIYFHNSIAC